ncbi:MAG TPA: ShlB/FhaC/HecB family hemolysin secretion/activation protein [Gemmatimonadaceae bacterium]|nr:ShlB/FhaC/HecB family hemolysin secretion/activation protein [Gemmatimonadaceae bacterium]
MRLLMPRTFIALALSALPVIAVAQNPRPVRRQPVTPELERSAFRDAAARVMLQRARAARLAQDSALLAYDANTYFRMSVGLGVRHLSPERLFLRTEHSARVRWSRDAGLLVEPTGRRTAFPMGTADMDMTAATPIPYFPGRESLWLPGSGVAQVEVNEDEMLHPLATGAEAYYRYATGDSASIRLPDGRTIGLRELRVTARRPEWRAFVGSFWFDVERGSLVRAAYRMAVEMDLWQMASEEQKRALEKWQEQAKTDTGVLAEHARREVEEARREKRGQLWGRMILTPARANIPAITVEYGLHESRFWLPRVNVAEGEILAGFVRIPMKFEERFRYSSVNVRDTLVVALMATDVAPGDTSYFPDGNVTLSMGEEKPRRDTSAAAVRAREDSLIRRYSLRADSLRSAGDSARAKGDTAAAREFNQIASLFASRARHIERRREGCARDTTYFAGGVSRFNGALHMAVRMPCDTSRFATSPDLPKSIFEEGEEVIGTSERDRLIGALGMGLQPDWAPRWPVPHTGIDMLRYNRIEGISLGASLTSQLGRGYTALLVGRVGAGDRIPYGDLSLSRSNGRTESRLGVYHRLAVANDDWGDPLSLGASIANVLYARDEGFYYRAYGAELAKTQRVPFGAGMQWRLFAEGNLDAGQDPNTQISLGNLFADPRFGPNIRVPEVAMFGGRVDLTRTLGANPAATRFDTRMRLEGAFTDRRVSAFGARGVKYGRVLGEMTLATPMGPFSAALTGAAGTSAGALPMQRGFFVGGLHTVRGQFARLDSGYVGNSTWLARGELGLVRSLAFRPSLFYDIGWAGQREDFSRVGRPLSGAGLGISLLDGLMRLDVARGIWPERRWRTDFSLGARF